MRLDLNQIRNIATGAVRVTEEIGGFNFYRFTAEQMELYKNRSQKYYNYSFSTSGITLRFKTDSETLFLNVDVTPASSRSYFSIELFSNGKPLGVLKNFEDEKKISNYKELTYPLGEFSKKFHLEKGEKEICIYLPWSVKTVIKELSIDDGAVIEPVKFEKKLLCFGDSITQGYDALYPSKKYTTQLSNNLRAEEYNKGIGGERFFSDMGELKENFVPDYITVAYGTNDWCHCIRKDVDYHCTKFLRSLSENYQESKIFVITPIWRNNCKKDSQFGSFDDIAKCIKTAASGIENIKIINGFDFVPHNEKFFGDLSLHPNDEGFNHYFMSLCDNLFSD